MVQFSMNSNFPGASGLMVNVDKHRQSLLGGARIQIARGEAHGQKEAMAPNRPQGDGILPGKANTVAGGLTSVNSKECSSKVSLGDGVGFTGLNNLGNTCFMSCVLQALANNKDLRDYFLSKTYLQDINEENPLGSKGRLAKSFSVVLKHLWSGVHKSYAPVKLKNIVATIAPQFLGFMQHDAQEFMAFFLDALHEDLNRVREKPVFEIPELGDQDEYLIASKSWSLHRSRNDSFIVDKFHGMYKSKLTCPTCSKESTTFDPFLFLPVPIPKPMKWINVTFFSYNQGPRPVKMLVPEEGAETCDVLSHIAATFSVSSSSLRLLQIESGNVIKDFSSKSLLPPLRTSPALVVCEVADGMHSHVFALQRVKTTDTPDSCARCKKTSADPGVKILRCAKCKTGYCSQQCQKKHWPQHKRVCHQRFIGCPFIVSLHKDTNYISLRQHLFKMATYSVDVFHSTQESPDSFDSQKQPFSIFMCHGGETTKSIPLKEDLSNLDISRISHLIIEWSSDVTVSATSIVKQNVEPYEPSVEDCIKLFTKPEILAAEEAWYCPSCKKHKEATKEISLWQLPDILIIQLKRFSFRTRIWRDKIDRLVRFPVNGLDMRPFCVKNQAEVPIFDLFAVVNHHGGLLGGHYTSYVRLSEEYEEGTGSGWRLCDDSSVTSIRHEDELVTASSYVMFYQRRKQHSNLMTAGGGDMWSDSIVDDASYAELPQASQYTAACEEASLPKELFSEKSADNSLGDEKTQLQNTAPASHTPAGQQDFDANQQKDTPQAQSQISLMKSDGDGSIANKPESDSSTSVGSKVENKLNEASSDGQLPYTDMDAVD